MGQKLIYVPECHSTNSLLNELNDKSQLPEGTVMITDKQTAGRGQRGNSWEAEPGLNLTFSLLLRPRFLEAKDQFLLSMAVSVAIAGALQVTIQQPIKLKWPNDIMVADKKIGGILIESQLQGTTLTCSVVGIGINVNQQSFIYMGATSMHTIAGRFFQLDDLFQPLMESIEHSYLDLRAGNLTSLKQRYLESLFKYNEPHWFESGGERFSGSIHDVDENGRLCVESQGAMRTFSFKEVKFLS